MDGSGTARSGCSAGTSSRCRCWLAPERRCDCRQEGGRHRRITSRSACLMRDSEQLLWLPTWTWRWAGWWAGCWSPAGKPLAGSPPASCCTWPCTAPRQRRSASRCWCTACPTSSPLQWPEVTAWNEAMSGRLHHHRKNNLTPRHISTCLVMCWSYNLIYFSPQQFYIWSLCCCILISYKYQENKVCKLLRKKKMCVL